LNKLFKTLSQKGVVLIKDGELRKNVSLRFQARFPKQTITETGTELKVVDYELESDEEPIHFSGEWSDVARTQEKIEQNLRVSRQFAICTRVAFPFRDESAKQKYEMAW
jgi:hypothetical protein